MKKTYLLGMAALIMLALAGCPGEDGPHGGPDGPSTTGVWNRGLNDFEVQTGDNPGEIKYKFTATDPEAESYTLYFAAVKLDSSAAIIVLNQTKSVTPQTNFTTLSGFTAGLDYSVVVEAKKGASDKARSGVKFVKAKEGPPPPAQMELSVNIPTGTVILAATLFGDDLLTAGPDAVPLAVGLNISGTFKFSSYEPSSPTQMGGSFTQTGEYYILLATTLTGAGSNYIYSANGQNPTKYNFTQATGNSIAWNNFVLQQ